jgi:hypothetical protein
MSINEANNLVCNKMYSKIYDGIKKQKLPMQSPFESKDNELIAEARFEALGNCLVQTTVLKTL